MTLEIKSTSLEDTLAIGEAVGKNLKGGEVIELISDLGGGKTVFVRGLARGINTADAVTSPTFTISRVYKSNDLELHHSDFYRLNDPGIIESELAESINDQKVAVAIEWAEVVKGVLPMDRLTVNINVTDLNSRIVKLSAGQNHQHLLKGLK